MSVKLPYMDTSAIQRGIDSIGNALQAQHQAMVEQQTAGAGLALKQKYNDMVNQFTQEQDFSGPDWGQKGRDQMRSAIEEAAAGITDERSRQAWMTSMASQMEDHTQTFRAMQVQKQGEQLQLDTVAKSKQAGELAATDPKAALDLATATFQPKYDAQGNATGFSQAAVMTYGSPVKAFEAFTQLHDGMVGAALQGRFDAVMNDESTSLVQKLEGLQTLKAGGIGSLEAGGFHVSPDQKKAFAESIDKTIVGVQTKAELGDIAGLSLAMQTPHSRAQNAGYEYNPTSDPAYKALAAKVSTTDGKNALAALADRLTLEADASKRGVSDGSIVAARKNEFEAFKAQMALFSMEGMTPAELTAIVQKGGITVDKDGKKRTFAFSPEFRDEALKYTQALKGLTDNTELKAVVDQAFKGLPADSVARLTAELLETTGGINRGNASQRLMPNGIPDIPAIAKHAADMAAAENSSMVKDIVKRMDPKNGIKVDQDSLVKYLEATESNQLDGVFRTRGGQISQAQVQAFTDAFAADLKKGLGSDQYLTMTPEIDNYLKQGLPSFYVNGRGETLRYTPYRKDGKVLWEKTTVTGAKK